MGQTRHRHKRSNCLLEQRMVPGRRRISKSRNKRAQVSLKCYKQPSAEQRKKAELTEGVRQIHPTPKFENNVYPGPAYWSVLVQYSSK